LKGRVLPLPCPVRLAETRDNKSSKPDNKGIKREILDSKAE
jgi:hypothetical protein